MFKYQDSNSKVSLSDRNEQSFDTKTSTEIRHLHKADCHPRPPTPLAESAGKAVCVCVRGMRASVPYAFVNTPSIFLWALPGMIS